MNESTTPRAPLALPKPGFIDLLLEKKQLLITIVVLIALTAGGVVFWMQKSKADEEKASLALSKVVPWIQTGDADHATKGLREVIGSYGGTRSGNMAKLYLATIYYTMNKPDDALAMYNAFKSDNKDLQASALAGAAACNVQKKAFAAAADSYEKASDAAENEALKSMYLNKAAENLIAAGKTGDAVKLLDKVIKSWPTTSSAAVAQRSLWRLSGQGVEVPAP
ncbi:MAG: tetratricopeptide repeat protein [Chlorobiaceae bacterium]|nr:tetratricopeptide repeat protein [Chlorobiales bacterium]NTU91711.1 tetratricopeptide repeat protein [Chlorobiaceae bacterium]NTV26408.1 tetratricopeptide repeat protein [Chlorobiaceae bacterium]